MGAHVVALDASAETIKTARLHAKTQKLQIDYRIGTVSDLQNETFDLILNMEVVEHVSNVQRFISACAQRLEPDGVMFISTINRTLEALLIAIIGGEYILRFLPIGTHHYEKLVTPDELRQALNQNGMEISDQTGVVYNPLLQRFHLSSNMRVNYMARTIKRAAQTTTSSA